MKTSTSTLLLLLTLAKAAQGDHYSKSGKQDMSMPFEFRSKSAKLAKGAKSLKEPIRRTIVDELDYG